MVIDPAQEMLFSGRPSGASVLQLAGRAPALFAVRWRVGSEP
jgi:hypothetical protein